MDHNLSTLPTPVSAVSLSNLENTHCSYSALSLRLLKQTQTSQSWPYHLCPVCPEEWVRRFQSSQSLAPVTMTIWMMAIEGHGSRRGYFLGLRVFMFIKVHHRALTLSQPKNNHYPSVNTIGLSLKLYSNASQSQLKAPSQGVTGKMFPQQVRPWI